jgi:integrase
VDYNVSYRKKDKGIQCIISYKDNDGRWRQKSKQGFKRQRDAKPWIDSVVEELEKVIKVSDEFRGITFGEFKNYFDNDKKRELAHNTKVSYEQAYAKFESLNDIPLIDLGYIHIKPCIDKMIDEGLEGSAISLYLAKIKTVLSHAIENYEIISVNPIKNKQYPLPKKDKNKINVLSKKDLEGLFSKLNGKDYFISLIAVKCGLRIGEIIGLTDMDIDFTNAEITIDKQWKLIGENKHGFGTPKSKNSYRTVPIPKDYVSTLKEYVKDCVLGMDRRIFFEKSTISTAKRLRLKYKRYGYNFSVHDLRHTYATTLLANGFTYREVAELIGDTEETVIKAYSHFTDDMYEDAKSKLNNIL